MNNIPKISNYIKFEKLKKNMNNKDFSIIHMSNLTAQQKQILSLNLKNKNINVTKIKLNLFKDRFISGDLNIFLKGSTYLLLFKNNLSSLVKFLFKNEKRYFLLVMFLNKKKFYWSRIKTLFKEFNLTRFEKDSDCKIKIILFLFSNLKINMISFIFKLRLNFLYQLKLYANVKSTD